ncbi:winged helix-turn-helix domain-containing protein [Paraburkholderia denitrificans]|uniref:Winged helix-turn-helix domain-containing protein n=1 Tax=Paraburkholderia denitrificans TaxID=694025 RepID=A0ABW0J5X8_9BURK
MSGKYGKHGAAGTHETRLKVLREIERGGEMDTATVSQRARVSHRAAGGHIRQLLDYGVLIERFEERQGRGRHKHRFVRRSDMPLPKEVEVALDKGWWPVADFDLYNAFRSMVSVDQAKPVPYGAALFFVGLQPVGKAFDTAAND